MDRDFNSKETLKEHNSQKKDIGSFYDQFEIDTYPKMQTFCTQEQIKKTLTEIIKVKEKTEEKPEKDEEDEKKDDFGIICEVDLS